MLFAGQFTLAESDNGYALGTDLLAPADARWLQFKRAAVLKLSVTTAGDVVRVVGRRRIDTGPVIAAADIGWTILPADTATGFPGTPFEITIGEGNHIGLDDVIVSPGADGDILLVWVRTM